jgi:hypothetical protein
MLAVACLDLVKATAGRFIERRQGGPLGLILFGSRAYLKTPLSYDCDSVRTLRDESFSAPRGARSRHRRRHRPGGQAGTGSGQVCRRQSRNKLRPRPSHP